MRKTTYKATFELINSIENNFSMKTNSMIINLISALFDKRLLVKFKRSVPNIYKITFTALNWIWIKLIRPIYLLIQGVFLIVKDVLSIYVFLSILLLLFLKSSFFETVLIEFKDVPYITYTFHTALFFTLSFFNFNYQLSKADSKIINSYSKKIQQFTSNDIKAIINNISLLKKKHNKQILFINAMMGFLWGFAALFFITAIKENIHIFFSVTLKDNMNILLGFLCFFILTRGYSKVYAHIFDVAEYTCNEALAIRENS